VKANKQTYVDFILEELNKGNVKFNDVCVLFLAKFGLTRQSFNKYWNIAKIEHSERCKAINEAKLRASIVAGEKAVTEAIMSKNQLLKKLEDIINQKAKRVDGQIVMPTFADVRGAIDTFAKMQGYYDNSTKDDQVKITLNIVERELKSDNI
jgi:hypothetical protein